MHHKNCKSFIFNDLQCNAYFFAQYSRQSPLFFPKKFLLPCRLRSRRFATARRGQSPVSIPIRAANIKAPSAPRINQQGTSIVCASRKSKKTIALQETQPPEFGKAKSPSISPFPCSHPSAKQFSTPLKHSLQPTIPLKRTEYTLQRILNTPPHKTPSYAPTTPSTALYTPSTHPSSKPNRHPQIQQNQPV